MTYKTLITTLILSFCVFKTTAAEVSETTNGVYLVISGYRPDSTGIITNTTILPDDKILWMTFCDKGETELSICDYRYSCKIRLTGTNGVEVPKTAKGNTFGTRFDQLQKVSDAKIAPVITGGSYKDNLGLGGAHFLSKPCELFEIDKPGIYTLEIQMQMFYLNPNSTNVWQRDLFRFSPVRLKVERP